MASRRGYRSDHEQAIVDLLASSYGRASTKLSRFSPDHPTYLAVTSSGRWVVRVGRNLHHHAAALRALQRAGYAAPRVIPSNTGSFVSHLRTGDGGSDAIVLTFTDGTTPELNTTDLYALGASLGRLHRHGEAIVEAASRPEPGLPAIERAIMLPDNELRFALSHLLPAQDRLPNRAAAAQWQKWVDACRAGLRPIGGLTQTFLHGDAHPWNSVIQPTGHAQYIDWDSSGPGPAIIDLGFLVMTCATGRIDRSYVPADPAVIHSLLSGYRSQMTLTQADLDPLDSAMAVRVLVFAAVGFGYYVQHDKDPLTQPGTRWSLQRLNEISRIADTIRTTLSPRTSREPFRAR